MYKNTCILNEGLKKKNYLCQMLYLEHQVRKDLFLKVQI